MNLKEQLDHQDMLKRWEQERIKAAQNAVIEREIQARVDAVLASREPKKKTRKKAE